MSYLDEYNEYESMLSDCCFGDIRPRKGNEKMEKKFDIMQPNCLGYKTYEDAEKAAKQHVAKNHRDYVIVQAVAVANTPTPDVAVTKL